MKCAWLALCVFLCACGSIHPRGAKKSREDLHLHDSLRVHFMKLESAVYGDFVQLRRFHLDLFQELDQKASPYPEMDSIFQLLHEEADSVIIQRLHFDANAYHTVDELLGRAQYHNVSYSFWKVRYDEIRKANHIERISLRQFGERIDEKISAWQDSVEAAGTALAMAKTHLKNRGLASQDKNYIAAYQPLSQMELSIKRMQASIMQLQNAQSRFSEANVEEFFYTGPFLRPRREIVATEGIISEIALHMNDIRASRQSYYAQFK